MSEPTYDNPAGRLVGFLNEVKSLAHKGAPTDRTMMIFLSSVLKTDPDRPGDLFARLGDVLNLPNEIRLAVTNTAEVSTTYMDFLPDVDQYLTNLVSMLTNQGPQIPPDAMLAAMSLCSEQLSLHASEGPISEDELKAIRIEIDKLIDDVTNAGLNDDLAQFILDHLRDLVEAIDRFQISGITPIREALSRLVGDLQINVLADDPVKGTDESRAFGDRMWKVVSRLADLVGISGGGVALTTFTMQALSSGHPH